MKPFNTPSLSYLPMRALVSVSDAGVGAVESLIVFVFLIVLVFKMGAWPQASK